MRVPAIFRWPGKIPAGTRTDAISFNGDIFPTAAHISGATLPNDRVLDGRNLFPLLTGKTDKSPHDHFFYFAGSRGNQANLRAVRDSKYKLILKRNPQSGALAASELYDLGSDVSERFDRLESQPEVTEKLLKIAIQFHNELKANQRPLGRLPQ